MNLTSKKIVPTIVAWLLLTTGSGLSSAAEQPRSVDQITTAVMAALGGDQAWQETRFIRFNFFGFRLHHWDKHTGRHRLEGKNREGQTYVVLHDLDSREGKAFVDGVELAGEELDAWLERAYGAWINDTYWLVMPYKLTDPGVALAYDREEQIDGVTYDVLRLTFDGVGLTPGDTYWAFINRQTNLMDRWAYFLESWEDDREPTQWLWTDWGNFGGEIMLSPRRFNVAEEQERGLEELAVLDSLPDSVFTSPEPVTNSQ